MGKESSQSPYSHTLAYVLSRVSFLTTHLVFAYWLNFIANDPLNLGTNTLDAKVALPPGKCEHFNYNNFLLNIGLVWGVWWGSHSLLARKFIKKALGLWQHPIDRPLFAFLAPLTWLTTIVFWKPINNCQSFDIFSLPLWRWGLSLAIFAAGAIQLLALLYLLPDHVFGMSNYKYPPGKLPHSGKLIERLPYNLVRHPAAAGFIWMYWSWPAYTPNHILLASLWTVFIVVGTLVFEEGGLRGTDEFGKSYAEYSSRVNAFYPSLYSFKVLLGLQKRKGE